MRTSRIFAVTFLAASVSLIGCKRSTDAQEDVIEARKKVEEEQRDVAEAQRDLARARAEFVAASQRRLAEIDGRIRAAQAESDIDHNRVAMLRAEAEALRTRAADPTNAYTTQYSSDFERIMRDIEATLTPDRPRDTTAPAATPTPPGSRY